MLDGMTINAFEEPVWCDTCGELIMPGHSVVLYDGGIYCCTECATEEQESPNAQPIRNQTGTN